MLKKIRAKPAASQAADSSGGDDPVDLGSTLALPSAVLQSGIVDQTNLVSVLEAVARVESTVEFHKKIISPNFNKFLSFCLNLLDLDVQGLML
jgi:hypothetical protein